MIDYTLDAISLAKQLIGCELLVRSAEGEAGGIITETEAYTAQDPASHSFIGKTVRNEAMFMSPGTLYVYKIYGIHHCINIVCGAGDGQAVLIRALQPTKGIELMKARRGIDDEAKISNGPGNLVVALGITSQWNGTHITDPNIRLIPPHKRPRIGNGIRVGVSKGTQLKRRFYT